MAKLAETLIALLDWLTERGYAPPVKDVRIFEPAAKPRFDGHGRMLVSPEQLHDALQYEDRFNELVQAGLPWINVSCYGVYEGRLIVGIEFPSSTNTADRPTSINYSGPSVAVLEQGWNAIALLSFE